MNLYRMAKDFQRRERVITRQEGIDAVKELQRTFESPISRRVMHSEAVKGYKRRLDEMKDRVRDDDCEGLKVLAVMLTDSAERAGSSAFFNWHFGLESPLQAHRADKAWAIRAMVHGGLDPVYED